MSLYYYATAGINSDSDSIRLCSYSDVYAEFTSILAKDAYAALNDSTAVCSDTAGNYYVFSGNQYVTSFDSSFALRDTWATSGTYSFDGTTHCNHMLVHPTTDQLLIITNGNARVLDSDGDLEFNCTLPASQFPYYAQTQAYVSADNAEFVFCCLGGTYGCIIRNSVTDGTLIGYYKNQRSNYTAQTVCLAAAGTHGYYTEKNLSHAVVLYKTTFPADGATWYQALGTSSSQIGTHILESSDATAVYVNEGTSIVKRSATDGTVLFSYDIGEYITGIVIAAADVVMVFCTNSGTDEDGDVGNVRVFSADLTKLATDSLGDQPYDASAGAIVTPISPDSESRYTKRLVAACQDTIWTGVSSATMAKLSASIDGIDCSQPLSLAEHTSKVFVANGSNKFVADFGNSKLNTTDLVGGDGIPSRETVLAGGTSGAQLIVDYIDASTGACAIYGKRITEATFSAGETVTGTNADDEAVSFVLSAAETAAPHWYAWTSYANDSDTYGSLPAKIDKVFVTQGRVGVSLNKQYPHQWYLSRQLNPWDWTYGEDDAQSAVAGNNTDAGEVGDIIVDVFPYKDAYVIFGCVESFWYLTGNPCQGGTINELDLTAGLLGPGAWCWDDADNLYAVTTKGLVRFLAGFAGQENLTIGTYPDLIKDLAFNRSTQRMTLSYDRERNGVLINIVTLENGANTNWWYDLTSKGLFPEAYPTAASIYCTAFFSATDPADTAMVLGGADGYLREFSHTAKSDDGGAADVAIDSYVSFGAIPLTTDARHDGTLGAVDLITGGGNESATAEDSDAITMTVFAERTSEQVVKSAVNNTNAKLTKIITGPGVSRGSVEKRRARGRAGVIKLRNATIAQSWALEHLNFNIKKSGKVR